jgi:hypothetical protein
MVRHNLMQTLKARGLYFVLVFSAGFVFGTIRTLWIVPRIGTRMAELTGTPIMFVVTVLAARWTVLRFVVAPISKQRAIDNFSRRPLTVSYSPPRRSYLIPRLSAFDSDNALCVSGHCKMSQDLRVGASFIPHPLIQNFVSRGISFSGPRRPKKSRRSIDRLRSQV